MLITDTNMEEEFENQFQDIENNKSDVINPSTGKYTYRFKKELFCKTEKFLANLDTEMYENAEFKDYTVYSGISGIVLLYLFVACKRNSVPYLRAAIDLVMRVLPSVKGPRVSFLNGCIGPHALAAVLYQKLGDGEKATEMAEMVKHVCPHVTNLNSDMTDDVMDGRAGYLHALLFINKHAQKDLIELELIKEVVTCILERGKIIAEGEKDKVNVPLLYKWQDSIDFGALHGISGILYILLQARSSLSESDLYNLIKPTIDFVMEHQLESGNFPLSHENKEDQLVQWCSGAPGVINLFCIAYKIFGEEDYRNVAEKCGQVVWDRGLSETRFGLCHGVAGNTYTFLQLYQITNNPNDLHRACKFAQWCLDYKKFINNHLDPPHSHLFALYEGLAGIIYMMIDLVNPISAKFPAFTI